MSQPGRHSVAFPLSKALVAVKRVQFLRDPATNSTNKFSASNHHRSNFCHGASLGLENGCECDDLDKFFLVRLNNHHIDKRCNGYESNYYFERPELKIKLSKIAGGNGIERRKLLKKNNSIEVTAFSRSDFDDLLERSVDERNVSDYNEVGLSCSPPSISHLSDSAISPSIKTIGLTNLERIDTKLLMRQPEFCSGKLIAPSVVGKSTAANHAVSPCLSTSSLCMKGPRIGTPLVDEKVNAVDAFYQGRGINCCWSRTPKFRDIGFHSDMEVCPLLSIDRKEMVHSCRERRSEYLKRELSSYSCSPRSLSQKFRPKSFNEMVGQHAVIQSLLSDILKRKVAPFYLFHGPRGTGKTTASRILAAALNCLSMEELRPCGFCKECALFHSGIFRDVKEIDAVKANNSARLKSILGNAALPPISSKYKVFIIDECQLLHGETWATLLNSINELPRYVVFVMITADIEKIPWIALSCCRRYRFLKIRDVDVVRRLWDICIQEDLEFEEEALHFIASKSNGSLRDAEIMLEQLSLLGKRITVSVAYQLIGSVCDDELLDLLDFALSSDTSNTVRRARELMKSRVDPMQLISQLANLIMDILAGRWQLRNSTVERKLFNSNALADVDFEKLKHALKILSETEKQLRTSRNQTTWLTVALLQFSAGKSACEPGNMKMSLKLAREGDASLWRTSIHKERLDDNVSSRNKHCQNQWDSDLNEKKFEKLEDIWNRAIELCKSKTLKRFLRKEGNLSSVTICHGLAKVGIEFCHVNHVSKAEKSWKLIASSLQRVLGCSVEIRMGLRLSPLMGRDNFKVKKPAFSLLNCSCGLEEKSFSNTEIVSLFSNESVQQNKYAMYSSNHQCHSSSLMQHSDVQKGYNAKCHPKDALAIISLEGNDLSAGTDVLHVTANDKLSYGCAFESDSSNKRGNEGLCHLSVQESEIQPSCFPKAVNIKRLLEPDGDPWKICLRIYPNTKLQISGPKMSSLRTCFCAIDPHIHRSLAKTQTKCRNASRDDKIEPMVRSKCWHQVAPCFRIRKANGHKLGKQRQRSRLLSWILHFMNSRKFEDGIVLGK